MSIQRKRKVEFGTGFGTGLELVWNWFGTGLELAHLVTRATRRQPSALFTRRSARPQRGSPRPQRGSPRPLRVVPFLTVQDGLALRCASVWQGGFVSSLLDASFYSDSEEEDDELSRLQTLVGSCAFAVASF